MNYVQLTNEEALIHSPKVAVMDEHNQIVQLITETEAMII
jgi:aspartate 1-decarboxylase